MDSEGKEPFSPVVRSLISCCVAVNSSSTQAVQTRAINSVEKKEQVSKLEESCGKEFKRDLQGYKRR